MAVYLLFICSSIKWWDIVRFILRRLWCPIRLFICAAIKDEGEVHDITTTTGGEAMTHSPYPKVWIHDEQALVMKDWWWLISDGPVNKQINKWTNMGINCVSQEDHHNECEQMKCDLTEYTPAGWSNIWISGRCRWTPPLVEGGLLRWVNLLLFRQGDKKRTRK